jgi:DNA-binding transcriptional ArsR family regulator
MSIARLTAGQKLTRQSITKHLRILTQAGLVRSVRRGRENCFAYKPEALEDARRSLDRVSRHWDAALERLREYVERDPFPGNAR